MRSLKFPRMFNTNSTNVWKSTEHKEATTQNCILLLNSERYELFGDPYYGLLFKHYLYEPNDKILEDNIIDLIYTQLALFIPQIKVERRNINLKTERGTLYCSFSALDQIDYTVDTYQLVLFKEDTQL